MGDLIGDQTQNEDIYYLCNIKTKKSKIKGTTSNFTSKINIVRTNKAPCVKKSSVTIIYDRKIRLNIFYITFKVNLGSSKYLC